jgi:hypothetical protein
MRCFKTFGGTVTDPETVISLLAIRGDTAHLGVQSILGTRRPNDFRGHTRSFGVRTRIQPAASYSAIVTDLLEVLCTEPCQALEADRSGGWQVVTALPPRPIEWKPPDAFDLVDWAAPKGLALAVPFPDYSPITSFPVTTIPGLAGNWIVLELN